MKYNTFKMTSDINTKKVAFGVLFIMFIITIYFIWSSHYSTDIYTNIKVYNKYKVIGSDTIVTKKFYADARYENEKYINTYKHKEIDISIYNHIKDNKYHYIEAENAMKSILVSLLCVILYLFIMMAILESKIFD